MSLHEISNAPIMKETIKKMIIHQDHNLFFIWYIRLPWTRHFKSRLSQLKRKGLHEQYSDDIMFSSKPILSDNCTCNQIFNGHQSHFRKVIRMIKESNSCEILETFIAEVGAPFQIINENEKL